MWIDYSRNGHLNFPLFFLSGLQLGFTLLEIQITHVFRSEFLMVELAGYWWHYDTAKFMSTALKHD